MLRAAEGADAADVLEYLRAAAATTDQILTQPDEMSKTPEAERVKIVELSERGGIRLMAWHEGRIIGASSLNPGVRRRVRHTAELGITVEQSWRGRGLGRAMIAALLEWAAANE